MTSNESSICSLQKSYSIIESKQAHFYTPNNDFNHTISINNNNNTNNVISDNTKFFTASQNSSIRISAQASTATTTRASETLESSSSVLIKQMYTTDTGTTESTSRRLRAKRPRRRRRSLASLVRSFEYLEYYYSLLKNGHGLKFELELLCVDANVGCASKLLYKTRPTSPVNNNQPANNEIRPTNEKLKLRRQKRPRHDLNAASQKRSIKIYNDDNFLLFVKTTYSLECASTDESNQMNVHYELKKIFVKESAKLTGGSLIGDEEFDGSFAFYPSENTNYINTQSQHTSLISSTSGKYVTPNVVSNSHRRALVIPNIKQLFNSFDSSRSLSSREKNVVLDYIDLDSLNSNRTTEGGGGRSRELNDEFDEGLTEYEDCEEHTSWKLLDQCLVENYQLLSTLSSSQDSYSNYDYSSRCSVSSSLCERRTSSQPNVLIVNSASYRQLLQCVEYNSILNAQINQYHIYNKLLSIYTNNRNDKFSAKTVRDHEVKHIQYPSMLKIVDFIVEFNTYYII